LTISEAVWPSLGLFNQLPNGTLLLIEKALVFLSLRLFEFLYAECDAFN